MKNQKEIIIQVPEGYEIDEEKSTFEKIVFKEVKEVLTYKDVAISLFKDKTVATIAGKSKVITWEVEEEEEDIMELTNSITEEQLESILALNKLCNVAKFLNGYWLPERKRGGNDKWFHYINYESFESSESTLKISKTNIVQYSIVYFKSKKLAEQAIEILGEEEIRKALTLNH